MNPDTDRLGRRLREEAQREPPAFSEPLHARVMAQVRAARITRRTAPKFVLAWWALPAALAAAVAVAVWIGSPASPLKPAPVTPTFSKLPQIPPLEKIVAKVAAPVRNQLHDARYAYLDRDGLNLANFLLQSLPGLHADPTHPPQPAPVRQ
jgi:hypothetical protein